MPIDKSRKKKIYPFVRKEGDRLKTMYSFYRQHFQPITNGDRVFVFLKSVNFSLFDTAGGDFLTLSGTNFGDSPRVFIDLGGSHQAECSVVQSTPASIIVTTPSLVAGSYEIKVVTSFGTSNGLSVEAWAPSELALTSFFEKYNGVVWASRTSTGTSGSRTLSGSSPPSIGTAINSKNPASFNGTSNELLYDVGGATLYTNSGNTSIILVNKNVAYTDLGNDLFWQNPPILRSNVNFITVHDTGVRAGIYLTGPWATVGSVLASFANSTWGLVQFRHDGVNEQIRVNTGAFTTRSSGVQSLQNNTLATIGYNQNGGGSDRYLSGNILCVITAGFAMSDDQLNKILLWARCRFGLPLI